MSKAASRCHTAAQEQIWWHWLMHTVTYLSSSLTGTEFKQNSWYVSKVGNKEIGTIQTDWLSDKAVQTPLTLDMSGP